MLLKHPIKMWLSREKKMSRMTRLSKWIYNRIIYRDGKVNWGTGVIDSQESHFGNVKF